MYRSEHDPFVTAFIVITFIFFMFFMLYFLYDCWCLPRSRRHRIRNRSRNNRPTMVFFPDNPSHTASRGLNPAIVKSLHVFTFSDATHKDPINCAVCLSEFEEGESGRVLHGCKHAFHVECIDMWFHSHSTCPLCRSLVELPVTTVEEQVMIITIPPEPVSATEPGLASGSGSSTMPLEDLGRNAAAIEVSRRNFNEFEDDLTQNLPANQPSTLSMNQILSFPWFLSKHRRSAPSSFAGAPSQSPSSSCQIVMTETNMSEERRD